MMVGGQHKSVIFIVLVALVVTGVAGLGYEDALSGSGKVQSASIAFLNSIQFPVQGRLDHMSETGSGRVFLAAFGNGSLVAIKPDRSVQVVPGFSEPQNALYVQMKNAVFVSNGGNGTVLAVDADTFTRLAAFQLGSDADNMRYSPSEGRVYVGFGSGGLGVIDVPTMRLAASISLPGHPESFQLERNGPLAFVNVPSAGAVLVVDRSKMAVAATWKLPNASENFPMALDEHHGRLFVGTRVPPLIFTLDTVTGRVIGSTTSCSDSDDLFYDHPNSLLYAVCGNGNVEVFASDLSGRLSLLASVITRQGARTGWFDPDSGHLYVAAPAYGGKEAELIVFGPQGPRQVNPTTQSQSANSIRFLIELNPSNLFVSAGGRENYSSIELVPLAGGIRETLNLSIQNPNPGTTITLSSKFSNLSQGSQSVVLSISTTPEISPGEYEFSISAVEGSSSQIAVFKFEVVPHIVFINGDAYYPGTLTVSAGSTVVWMNIRGAEEFDSFLHYVQFLGNSSMRSPPIPLYSTWAYTFHRAGTYSYFDTLYPQMSGTVVVT